METAPSPSPPSPALRATAWERGASPGRSFQRLASLRSDCGLAGDVQRRLDQAPLSRAAARSAGDGGLGEGERAKEATHDKAR
jgi:hypothetical protein